MPTGSQRPCRQAGFTYLLLLLFVALSSAGLAALGERWTLTTQRERELELLFRGDQIARAIASYWAASPGPVKQLPHDWADLLEDRRSGKPLHHLRRLWSDPITGKADWVLVRSKAEGPNQGGIEALHSASTREAILTTRFGKASPGQKVLIEQRVFTPLLQETVPAVPSPAKPDKTDKADIAQRLAKEPGD